MGFNTSVWVSIITVSLILFAVATFLFLMFKQQMKIKKGDYPDCPDLVFNRYKLWTTSFSWWSVIQYFLILIPIFTSAATVYFTTDFLVDENSNSAILSSIMSFVSALLPLVNSKIHPKVHADGFYKGAVKIEQAILRHKEGIIDTKKLLEIFKSAERDTNPLLDKNEQLTDDENGNEIEN